MKSRDRICGAPSRHSRAVALGSLALVALLGAGCEREVHEPAAVAAATAWLDLVDQARYIESWDSSAGLFRKSVAREAWSDSLTEVRTPLGQVESRERGSVRRVEQLPRAPKGNYIMIRFETSFEHRPSTFERVVTVQEEGQWRVAGYFVQ